MMSHDYCKDDEDDDMSLIMEGDLEFVQPLCCLVDTDLRNGPGMNLRYTKQCRELSKK